MMMDGGEKIYHERDGEWEESETLMKQRGGRSAYRVMI